MDDHVHVVVTPYPNQPLERLIQSWKARSAARFRQGIRVAPFWQRGYYDRIIRSPSDLEEKVRYVAMNPAKRWLGVVHYPWLWVGAEPARALTGRGHHG
jgi:REP element-mobilizing transposase RayT